MYLSLAFSKLYSENTKDYSSLKEQLSEGKTKQARFQHK